MNQIAIAGNKGKGVRSDCFITLELTKQGGITVDIVSKVKVLYGRQIEEQIKNILSFYEIKNAKVSIEDSGAISLVIAARMEACIKRLIKTDKEYLMPFYLTINTLRKEIKTDLLVYIFRAIRRVWL